MFTAAEQNGETCESESEMRSFEYSLSKNFTSLFIWGISSHYLMNSANYWDYDLIINIETYLFI